MTAKGGSVLYAENAFRYYFAPSFLLAFCPFLVQCLAIAGRGGTIQISTILENLTGNAVAWNWLVVICLWSYYSLKIPSNTVLGPETPYGQRPVYQDNGFAFYWVTLGAFLFGQGLWPGLSASLYDNYLQLLGSFNLVALILCLYLWIKGKYYREFGKDVQKSQPFVYEYYRGMELHPRIFGVDVKQLTNCRIGLGFWQVFITAFFITGYQRNGFTYAALVDLLLQTIYIAKFFWWEAGYFYTLDMMLDRAGYYLCWGCLNLVTSLYTFSSYYLVANPSILSTTCSATIFVFGLLSIVMNYRVDYEKQVFRASKDFKCTLWGQPVTYLTAEYKDVKGETRKTALLTSGCWGLARHLNYTFELMSAFSWCLPGALGNTSIFPLSYFFFLFILLVHRIIRDEDKCSKKYGRHWGKYCKRVPYRLIPYVW